MPGVRNQAIPRTRFLFAPLSPFKNEENGNHPKSPVLLNKKLASSSLASFFIIEGKHLLHLLLTSVVSQIV